MADEDLDEETRAGFLATTREQVDRLTKLAADLLDLSRMDAGRIRVEQEEVVLADAARGARRRARPRSPRRRVTRFVLEADDEAWALADEERVLQIGRALAGNALTHTPPGTEIVLDDGACAPVGRSSSSRTTGPGFPASTLSGSSTASTASRARRPRAAASASRSLASLPSGWAAPCELERGAGRTTFTLSLPAAAVPAGELAVST